jgi:hypothetical protein
MSRKIGLSFLSMLLLLVLLSCKSSLPESMPELGENIESSKLNTNIQIKTPKECNTFKPGKGVCLQIENLTDKIWKFNVYKDILIFRFENHEWKKISDNTIHIGTTEFMLDSKGQFPLDKYLIGVLPDVAPDQPVELRIFIIAHPQNQGEFIQDNTGAFIDVVLKP